MYMDDIKLLTKNKKELETLIQTIRIYSLDIGMDSGIEKMSQADKEKRKTTNEGRKRTAKSRKNQNAWTKGNLQVLASTNGDERKN